MNLFDTFVLVSWLGVLLGFVVEYFNKRSLGLIVAGVTGFAFLHVAGRYAADGDTMGVVVAVLDSNFWLATHVITIIMGYAGCMAAGVIAHMYLIQRVIHPVDTSRSQATARAIYGVLAFGLVFTTVGTVLGGIWADQSWGRFWGWDPKENGALLIVLWCSAVFHARAAGMIKHIGFASGAIVGTVLVMFAWLGVNLLGVGLHSYGFTSSGAKLLFSFVGIESLFLLATLSAYSLRRKAVKAV
jgi:ABC-type transport system involved in cytochrome c biogenesis permease subunit